MTKHPKFAGLAAVAALLGAPALAQEADMTRLGATSGVLDEAQFDNMLRAENIIGSEIYSIGADYDETVWDETNYYDEIDTDWEQVGEVEDMIMSRDGNLVGIVASVGGWLDIGDEDVVIGLDDLRVVGDTVGEYSFVTRMSEERMEMMPEADTGWYN